MEQEEGHGIENKQPQPPNQTCPRCDSPNTKFCYYNNYSLSQPRYLCKECKRYWTQGGTLRNIPVGGGGSRKAKRAKRSSSSRSQPQPQPKEVVQNRPNILPTVIHSTSPYYQGGGGGGSLSSLAAVHSLNASRPFNQSLEGTGDAMGSSNSALLYDFDAASLGSQHHHPSQTPFYQVGNTLYPAEQGLIPSSVANNSAASHHSHHWPQNFISADNHGASDASNSTTSISGNIDQNNIRGGFSSLIPNHWPDLPGYGPPPQ